MSDTEQQVTKPTREPGVIQAEYNTLCAQSGEMNK